MGKRIKCRFTGVYTRESDTRRFLGKPDIYFEITFKHHGRKVWEKIGWKSEGYTAQSAMRIRSERVREIENHGKIFAQDITFGEAWELFARDHLPTVITAGNDIGVYKNHLAPLFRDALLSQITPRDLEQLRDKSLAAGLAPQSVKHILSLVRRVYKKMIVWRKYYGAIPTSEIKFPRVDNARYRHLTKLEAKALLAEIKTRSLASYRISLLSLHTGMRAGEVFKLKWMHVDIDTGTIHVMDTKKNKGRKAIMTPSVRAMFLEIPPGAPGALVFPARSGKQRTQASKSFGRSVDALGLNDGITDRRGKVVFHSLRHTFASWLAMRGVPLYVVGELMGHSTEAMTRRYSHLSPNLSRKAVQFVEAEWTGAATSDYAYGQASGSDTLQGTPADTEPFSPFG